MERELHTLAETELYSWMLSRSAPVTTLDEVLGDLTWAIARLAPDLALGRRIGWNPLHHFQAHASG